MGRGFRTGALTEKVKVRGWQSVAATCTINVFRDQATIVCGLVRHRIRQDCRYY